MTGFVQYTGGESYQASSGRRFSLSVYRRDDGMYRVEGWAVPTDDGSPAFRELTDWCRSWRDGLAAMKARIESGGAR